MCVTRGGHVGARGGAVLGRKRAGEGSKPARGGERRRGGGGGKRARTCQILEKKVVDLCCAGEDSGVKVAPSHAVVALRGARRGRACAQGVCAWVCVCEGGGLLLLARTSFPARRRPPPPTPHTLGGKGSKQADKQGSKPTSQRRKQKGSAVGRGASPT